MINKNILTIDGPAASGKGTIARALARVFDMAILDTGLVYRLLGLTAYQSGIDPHDDLHVTELAIRLAEELARTSSRLDNPELRGRTAGMYASVYAIVPSARTALINFQRNFALHPPVFADGRHPSGAILDGRDCGTIICPEAPLKLYVTAHVDIRAHRRHLDLTKQGENVTYNDILQDLIARDHRDMIRAVAPTLPAEGAIILDTTDRSVTDLVTEVTKLVIKNLNIQPTAADHDIQKHQEELQ